MLFDDEEVEERRRKVSSAPKQKTERSWSASRRAALTVLALVGTQSRISDQRLHHRRLRRQPGFHN